MTETSAPSGLSRVELPKRGQVGTRLSWLAAVLGLIAGLLLLSLSVVLGLQALHQARAAAEIPPPAAREPRAAADGPATPPAAPEPSAPKAADGPPLAAPPATASLAGAVPRQLLIDLGPPRSEVFVDGRPVGRTPFVGQVRCSPGREIRIQVVPARGLPLEERRVCPD